MNRTMKLDWQNYAGELDRQLSKILPGLGHLDNTKTKSRMQMEMKGIYLPLRTHAAQHL
jgi:hypothetical protein